MIIRKDIEGMSDGQQFETVALIKSYEVRPTKNGGKYLDGMLEMKGSVPFKVWSGTLFDEMDKCEYQGTICHIVGKVNDYNDKKSVILSEVRALEKGVYDESDFFEEKYPIMAYVEAMNKIIEKNCSSEIVSIFKDVMGDVSDRFNVEFAARGHHDAVRGGLLAHTYKVTRCMSVVIKSYQSIIESLDLDLLYLGCAFHDIGKIKEYTNGTIQGNGLLVSHHTFGVEMLLPYKERIISVKSEEFFYRLLSIIEQHHGEYEEQPRTIEAYIVHLFDNLEATLQSINESYERGLNSISINGFKLN